MLKSYKYLYYRIYAWNLKTWGESDLPQFNALFGVSFLIFLNLYFLVGVISYVSEVDLFKAIGWSKFYAVVLGTAIAGMGFFVLVKNENYKAIATQFKDESDSRRIRNLVLCIFYAVASIVSSFGWLYLRLT